ncbi:MAG: HYR domain-containing protein [Bacteroidia bacterium]
MEPLKTHDCTEAAYSFTVKAEVTCTNPVFVNTNAQVQANTTATTCNAVVNYPLSVTGIPAPGLSYSFSGATTGSGAGTGSGKTFNKGTTHVVVTAVNPCSTVVNEFDVIVSDITPPIAIAQNLVVNLDANGAASVTAAQINNGSSDNCGIASISLSKTSFGCNNVGTNNVILTVTDVNGNVSTATAVVTVVDDIKPSITAPAMVSVVNTPGSCMAAVNLGTPETSDNCGVASVTNNAPALFPVGTTIVRWTVTDIHGNVTDTATQEVVVIDNENPTITVSNISVNNDATKCFATVTVDQPETADNCGVSSVVGVRSDNQPLTATYPVGTTTITWTVTDIHGNIKTAVQTIVVTDNEKPSITAPAMISVVNTPGLCTASVNLGTPVTSDNCGVATVTNNAPALFPVGTTIVRWTVTDIHGNVTDTATQEVVVIDNENPTITVNNISVNNDAGKCGATVAISLPETADNCGVATVMGVRSDNKLLTEDYPVGTTIITWTVRDVNGNVKTATQTIVVTDNEKPVIACAANQVFCANTGGNTQYTVPVLNQSDNCGIASTTYTVTGATNRTGNGTNASGSFAIGTSTVTYTVTDIHGNVSTCSFTVTINPLPVASIAAPTADAFCNQFTLTANSTLSGPFTYQWMFGNNTKATTQQLSLGLTDADGVYSVYTTDANGCRSELPATYNYQKQTLVSSYTILATKEVKLGQYDKVESGSVGVMSSRGEAEFEKYSSVTGAGSFVKAPRIDTDKGVTINSKIYGVASVTLPTMQYNVSNTRYLQDKTINSNVTATVSGNYDEVTLKKGSNVTLTGTVFGKIKLEEGASVRFTSTTIDVAEIQIEKGPKNGGYSYIRFAPNTSIRVSKKVTIGSDVIVNPEAYQVTFYMADNRRDEEKFHVKGDDTRITANIILPDGKLKVTGGNYGDDKCDHRPHSANSCRHRGHGHHDCDHRGHGDKDCRDDVYMTGLFIAEEVESEGKNVIWNSFSCGAGSAPVDAVVSSNNKATVTEEASSLKLQAASKSEEELKVVVMPNPTRTFFTIKLESKYDAPVTMRMVDASGRVVESRTQIGSNSTIQVGHNYNAGNYFAEFVQGNRRKTIQLIKVR